MMVMMMKYPYIVKNLASIQESRLQRWKTVEKGGETVFLTVVTGKMMVMLTEETHASSQCQENSKKYNMIKQC